MRSKDTSATFCRNGFYVFSQQNREFPSPRHALWWCGRKLRICANVQHFVRVQLAPKNVNSNIALYIYMYEGILFR